jgi:hypothetical protein
MATTTIPDPNGFLDHSAGFLQYGPLGLAGLMLALAIFALIGTLDEHKARFMRQFLYIGCFCFFVSSVFVAVDKYVGASHLLHFHIEPSDLGKSLPPPVVSVNSHLVTEPFDYAVATESTVIVDVTDAIKLNALYMQRDERQRNLLSSISVVANASIGRLAGLNQLAVDRGGCPGGSGGIPIPHGGDMAGLASAVLADLTTAKNSISTILQEGQPSPTKVK